jgi:hypothetical protein
VGLPTHQGWDSSGYGRRLSDYIDDWDVSNADAYVQNVAKRFAPFHNLEALGDLRRFELIFAFLVH